ncbi:hypothetical protein [Streptomyces lunaelactis]|uniref:hypothetical protein n=1 Tax=Streptomyces lunaelactis TaxID=1535768 RepID=UPI0035A0C455
MLARNITREVREEDLVESVRTSLPYAYTLIAGLVDELRDGVARPPAQLGVRPI